MDTKKSLPKILIPLNSATADFSKVGGKGDNLVKLVHKGFLVPDGFILPTSAYQEFVLDNHLGTFISKVLSHINSNSPDELDQASQRIRKAFLENKIAEHHYQAIRQGWEWLGSGPVAVRSSATAEDLPGMSFAGQQDTFLNIIEEQTLIDSVVKCWSSLWTSRAIGYRNRNRLAHKDVSLAVIVQKMVQSQASGVLFTANPLTGLRNETVIDATLGLGEALVSGLVEPDNYVVDTTRSKITSRSIGKKSTLIQGQPEGGVKILSSETSSDQAIPDKIIIELAQIGERIESLYDFPQDIEWAWAEGQIHILQTRPITSLFPIPDDSSPDQVDVYFSFGAVQGLLDPITPLGQDTIRLIFAGGTSLFGFSGQDQQTQTIIKIAGERLWGKLTSVIRNPMGAKLILKVFPGIEPGSLPAIKEILSDPKIEAGSGRIRPGNLLRLFKFMGRMLRRMIFFAHRPQGKASLITQAYQDQITQLQKKYSIPDGQSLSLGKNLELYREIYGAFIYAIPEIASGILPGLLPLGYLSKLSNRYSGSNDLALQITRGLQHNVTTEMDLLLWKIAKTIKYDSNSYQYFSSNNAEDMTQSYLTGDLPEIAQAELGKFLEQYGMRGPGEIDIGRPRWREDPTQVLNTIQSYLAIEDESSAPDEVFKRGQTQAGRSMETLQNAVRKKFAGTIRARIVKEAVIRVRELGGLRESPKFFIIQLMGIIRQSFLKCGEEMVQQGKLSQNDDLFFLYLDELDRLARGEERNWDEVVSQRRKNYQRELLRKQIPRLLVSDGRTYYEGLSTSYIDEGHFTGSPVSPGLVEGSVRIVTNPHRANLLPGEILVCPGTDPAWTPLFLVAGGLLMEVGGLMTHGAIVAREYGIPAVVGVNQATQLLETGQRIRLNGSTGLIEIIDQPAMNHSSDHLRRVDS